MNINCFRCRRLMPAFAALLLVAAAPWCAAQTLLTPGYASFEKKWLKSGRYEMACLAGGTEVSSFVIEINSGSSLLSVYTTLTLSGGQAQWIDTSVADANTFKPVYRSSFNPNRELVLHYGKEVTGYHYDKKTQKRTTVKDPVKETFFDNYIYPYLLVALPLATGYHANMPVYDYSPEHTHNVKTVVIEEVKSGLYESAQTGQHKTWQVTVLEQANGDKYTYHIDKEHRRIWKIDVHTKGQHIQMIDRELDHQPVKSNFDKTATLKLVKSGSAVIKGRAFARDNKNGGMLRGMAVLNINKKQYAGRGTNIVLIPYTDFFREWIRKNEAARKKGKPGIPLPREAADCIKTATVYDDEGNFEFMHLMPGEFLLFTEFAYSHSASQTDIVGYTDTYINGMFQGSTANTETSYFQVSATASVKKVITISSPGETVTVKLKQTL